MFKLAQERGDIKRKVVYVPEVRITLENLEASARVGP
jgi:hypothetical protein